MDSNLKKETLRSIYKELGSNQEILDSILDDLVAIMINEDIDNINQYVPLEKIENLNLKISDDMYQICQDIERLRYKLDTISEKKSLILPSKKTSNTCEL